MRIEQAAIAISLQHMGERFRQKYKLAKYSDLGKPAIFYGCLSSPMLRKAYNHKSLAIILWCGTDAKNLSKHVQNRLKHPDLNNYFSKLKQQSHIRHIAKSEFIAEDLKRAGLEYKFIPVVSTLPEQFKVCTLGEYIYTYGLRRPEVYNKPLVEEVIGRLKDVKLLRGEIGTNLEISYSRISDYYRKCFIGLRLTSHDGLPNTVVEMGLMGIRCIYNGSLPNAIKWTGVDDIVDSIRKEQSRIGCSNEEVAREMFEYINIPDDWLDSSYWD